MFWGLFSPCDGLFFSLCGKFFRHVLTYNSCCERPCYNALARVVASVAPSGNLREIARYRPPVLIIIFCYKIYSLCKNNAISKVLNKLQVFHFRCTVHTNTTPTVITHSCVLQEPPSCNNNGYKVIRFVDQIGTSVR